VARLSVQGRVEVLRLHNQGLAIQHIARETRRSWWTVEAVLRRTAAAGLGYHPAAVSGPPDKRAVNPTERVVDELWATRIDALIAPPSKLLATSVFEIIRVEGYPGSYPSVVPRARPARPTRTYIALRPTGIPPRSTRSTSDRQSTIGTSR